MAYTSEEIQAAVEKLVLSKIRVPLDISGVRNNQTEYSDIQTSAAGVFISNPEAPYYIIALGANRLSGEAQQLLEDIANLSEKIDATGRRTYPVKDLTPLADAENALLELESALGRRPGSIRDSSQIPSYLGYNASSLDYLEHVRQTALSKVKIVEATGVTEPAKIPSYLRFVSSIDNYLKEIGRNIKHNGQVVETPNQARLEIPALFNDIIDSYLTLSDKQTYLKGALDDYAGMQLPAKVAQGVVQNARDVLSSDRKDLENMGEDKRLEVAKDKTLNALTAKAVVDSYVSGQSVTDVLGGEGAILPYADSSKEATAAKVDGDLPGPYPFISYPVPRGDPPDSRDTNRFLLTLQTKQYELILPLSLLGFVQGNGKTNPPDDPSGIFTFYGPGVEGTTYAENFDGNEDKPELWYFPDPNGTLVLEQYIEGGATTRYTIGLIQVGDPLKHFVPDALPDWHAYKVGLTLDQVVIRINAALSGAGSYLRAVATANNCLQIKCDDPIQCLVNRVVGVRCVNDPSNTASENPLGFVKGLELSSKRTPATSLVTTINGLTSKANAALAAYPLDPSLVHMPAWTDTANKSGVILALWTGYVTVTAGTNITLTLGLCFDPFTSFGIQVGHIIHFPRQYVQDGPDFVPMPDEGAKYQVDTVSDYTITAHKISGATVEAYHTRNVDIGTSLVLSTVAKYQVVQIFTPPNDGGFEIVAIDTYSPFRVSFDVLLSQNVQARDPLPLILDVTLGPAAISLASADLTIDSYIKVEGSARPLVYSTVPSARGFTNYVQLPEKHPKVIAGDKLEFWESSSVSYTRTIELVEERILTLDGSIPSELQFDIGVSTYPHVYILSGKKKEFDSTKADLESWDNQYPTDIGTYAANMNALLNPLLTDRVPPLGKVQAAKTELDRLKTKVEALAASLQGVDATPVPAIDDLLNTLKSKGCDRAVDILLQGRFSEFFGMDMDDATYAGSMMKSARDVARNDLSSSKFGSQRMQRKILSMSEDSDPDYDHSDSDAMPSPPDIVSGSDMPSWG